MFKPIFATGILAAVSVGGCPTSRPPVVQPPAETAEDPYAGLPEECRELAEPCSSCDEVEQMRRRILEKKCVPVCDAYVEAAANIDPYLDDQGRATLQTTGVCGKEGTTCSAIQDSGCEFAVRYPLAGAEFRKRWEAEDAVPPAQELFVQFHAEFLVPYLDLHSETFKWATANEADALPIVKAGAALMDLQSKTVITGVRGELTTKVRAQKDEAARKQLEARYDALVGLLDLLREPADAASFEARRGQLEPILRGEAGSPAG